MLSYSPLAVALLTLHIEWFVQRHYLESIRDDQDLDPQFKSLLKHHWLEEAQHTKLDTLMVDELAAGMTPDDIRRGRVPRARRLHRQRDAATDPVRPGQPGAGHGALPYA